MLNLIEQTTNEWFLNDKTRRLLNSIDWDFHDEPTNSFTHNYHPYPARFIPQIPRELIKIFTNVGDVIFDPFVGCGTTCIEANVRARDALGCDISGLATLISKVKTTPISDDQISEARRILQLVTADQFAALAYKDELDFFDDKWFEPHVRSELAAIRHHIGNIDSNVVRDFCFIALSAILVRVSKQDSDTRYVRKMKNFEHKDVLRIYGLQLEKMIGRMQSSRDALNRGTTTLLTMDSREPFNSFKEVADFVVTSPPYPNAYDYHLYHKHRLLMLDMNPSIVKNAEIGAHVHYSKKNGLTEFDFFNDMERVFNSVASVLKCGRCMAVVIGDSILKGRRICNSEIVKNAATTSGFEYLTKLNRRIHSQRKSFNPAHGNIVREEILLFGKDQ